MLAGPRLVREQPNDKPLSPRRGIVSNELVSRIHNSLYFWGGSDPELRIQITLDFNKLLDSEDM
jgi:hypothetical protein